MNTPRIPLLLGLLAVLAGCRHLAPSPPIAATAQAPGVAAIKPPDDLLWVQTSAEYRAVTQEIYRFAAERLAEFAAGKVPGTWAVTLDGDETLISNVVFEKRNWLAGTGYSDAAWERWVLSQEATPVPGASYFLAAARRLGGKIVVVTNRAAKYCPATAQTLERLELPVDAVLCPTDGTSSQEKEARWEAVARGTARPDLPPLEILMWVGDNIKDFPDLTQSSRDDPGALAEFGRRYILLPNPLYGSWDKNKIE